MTLYLYDLYAFALIFSTSGAFGYSYYKGHFTFREKTQDESRRLILLGVILIIVGCAFTYFGVTPGIFLVVFGLLYFIFTTDKSTASVGAAAMIMFLGCILLILFSLSMWLSFIIPDSILGDEHAAGAMVVVDGRKVGVMEEQRGKDGHLYSVANVRLPQIGEFEIEFISPDGVRLRKKITNEGELYLRADFEKMRITN